MPGCLGRPAPRECDLVVHENAFVHGLLATEPESSSKAQRPDRMPVMIGFYVNAIRDVDWDQRRFYVDLYWWIRYPATGDWPASDVEAIEFVNADPTTLVQKELERKTIDVGTGPEIYVNYRTVAFFHFDPDFHRYPFDVHTLPIVVEHETQQVERLFFVDDIDSYADSIRESVLWGLDVTGRFAYPAIFAIGFAWIVWH
jgi:hypothetical protein